MIDKGHMSSDSLLLRLSILLSYVLTLILGAIVGSVITKMFFS